MTTENPFDTITLNCLVEYDKNLKDTYGKLTALFVYNPNYFHTNSTKRVQSDCARRSEERRAQSDY